MGQARREIEAAAYARFAFHPDAATHEVDQLDADGEPQARTAELARHGAVRLTEGLKDEPLLVSRNADPGIFH